MRVLCPACDAQYDVPDRLIGTGRRLRCARCDHDWAVRPPPAVVPEAVPAEAPAVAPAPLGVAAEARPAPARRPSRAAVGGLGLWLAWLASVGAVLLALAGLWLFRAELSGAWPPIQRLYGLLG